MSLVIYQLSGTTYISCQNRSECTKQVTFDIQMTLESFARGKTQNCRPEFENAHYDFFSNVVWNVHLLKIFWCFQEHQTTNVQSLEWCLFKCSFPDLNASLFNSNSFTSYMSIVYISTQTPLSIYLTKYMFTKSFTYNIFNLLASKVKNMVTRKLMQKVFFIKIAARHKKATTLIHGKLSQKSKHWFGLKNICCHPKKGGWMTLEPTKHNVRPII